MMKLKNGVIVNDSGGVGKRITLPPVPLSGDQAQQRFNNAVAEAIGQFQNGPRRAVTIDELPGAVSDVIPAVDNRVPPPPSGLVAAGAFRNIMLEWDYPAYDYHAFTRIFRANVDDFNQSAVLATTEGKVWADNVGTDQSFYYWVANVSQAGIQSALNGIAGTHGQTAPDVDFLLETLQGQVLASTLAANLQARIDLIDGNGAGSVNARISTETTSRTDADAAITQTHNNFVSQYGNDQAAIQQTFTTHAGRLGTVEAEYTLKLDANGRVAGIGIATDATLGSQIVMLADKFSIVIPGVNGGTPAVPFIATTIGGVAGVGISSAFIGDAAISRAKIADAAIDDAKIANLSAAKVTFGVMSGDRIDVNTLNANRIITSTLVAKLATITDAYIVNANITNLTIGTEKFTPNAMSNCAYVQIATGGAGSGFPANTWADFDTATSGGAGGGTGGGPIGGGGTGGGRPYDTAT